MWPFDQLEERAERRQAERLERALDKMVRAQTYRPGVSSNRRPSAWVDEDGFFQLTGPSVGRYSGDMVPAVYAAVNLLAYQMGMLQAAVHDPEDAQPEHTISMLLRYPSRTIDPWHFWTIMWRAYFTHGNAYAWIRRDFSGMPVELVPAWCVNTEFVESRYAPYQKYTLSLLGSHTPGRGIKTTNRVANSRDVIVFHGPGYDGLRSPSPIANAASRAIETMRAVMEHNPNLLKGFKATGSAIEVLPEAVGTVGDTALRNLEKLLILTKQEMDDAEDEDRPIFMPAGTTLKRLQTLSNVDLQLIDFLRWGVEDIARIFGVSPVRLGHYHEGMRARTFEAQTTDFERFSIAPHVRMAQEQLSRKLLTMDDLRMNLSIMLPTDSLKHGALSERIMAAKMAASDGGYWTINEARELTGRKPRPDGDKLLQPKGAPTQDSGGGTDDE